MQKDTTIFINVFYSNNIVKQYDTVNVPKRYDIKIKLNNEVNGIIKFKVPNIRQQAAILSILLL